MEFHWRLCFTYELQKKIIACWKTVDVRLFFFLDIDFIFIPKECHLAFLATLTTITFNVIFSILKFIGSGLNTTSY
jgi:hypothetical protein